MYMTFWQGPFQLLRIIIFSSDNLRTNVRTSHSQFVFTAFDFQQPRKSQNRSLQVSEGCPKSIRRLPEDNQSEGFPRTGYFIPAHVGSGAGPDLSSFRRRRPANFLAKSEVSEKVRFLNKSFCLRGQPNTILLKSRNINPYIYVSLASRSHSDLGTRVPPDPILT